MISNATALRIAHAYREISAAQELLKDVESSKEEYKASQSSFQHHERIRMYEMGIPSGANSHRLYRMRPELAESVIRAHIADKERELAEANEQARIELNTAA